MSGTHLVRLYDLGEPARDGLSAHLTSSVLGVRDGDGASVAGVGVGSYLTFTQDGKPVGSIELHPYGVCSLGRVTLHEGHTDRARSAAVLRRALHYLHWSGFAYCLLDEVPDDPLIRAASVAVPEGSGTANLLASSADDPSLAYGDIFVDLTSTHLPDFPTSFSQEGATYTIRRPEASEQRALTGWIEETFGAGWASEVQRSFANTPISSVIAVQSDDATAQTRRPVGFISYNTTRRGMLSSIAVRDDLQGVVSRIGAALLTQCLHEARMSGLSFALLGGVSRRVAALRICPGSWTVPGSHPSVFGRGINAL
ncbi:hypothetical protein [Kineococcus sp. SYSU DK005]|uniref:hypothetical protein n=1 Tax=Kineococcus sp. SYSU DK005 TaxID=3383126 RepID=UPI003D7C6BBC